MILFSFFLFFQHLAFGTESLSFSLRVNDFLKKNNLKRASFGLVVSESSVFSGEKKAFYALNPDRLFIPASLTKIATLSALFHYYPVEGRFQSQIVSSASLSEGVLDGDLVFKGGGDAAFTSESLWNLVNVLVRTGLKRVEGDVLVDDRLYKPFPSAIYTDRSYESPVSAASFNWNSVTFHIRPGWKVGDKARIFVNPENKYIQIKNKVITSHKNTNLKIHRVSFSKNGEVFSFKGRISKNEKEITKYKNIRNPASWLGHNLVSFLKQRGISVKGRVKKGNCSSCKVLAELESRPFSLLAYSLMKYSNNFVSRMLTSHLPIELGGKRGDYKSGLRSIRKHLTENLKLKKYSLVDSSGLSRLNRFSPRDLQSVLIKDSQKFHGVEILFSYPLARGVGTLEGRFKKKKDFQWVRAKTGSISGVIGLAGFARNSLGKSYVFTFMYNGSPKKMYQVQSFFDELVLFLLK